MLLLIKLLRRDPLNEHQLVLLELLTHTETPSAYMLMRLYLPHSLCFSFPAKFTVEINHEAEVKEEKSYENKESGHTICALHYFQAIGSNLNEGM